MTIKSVDNRVSSCHQKYPPSTLIFSNTFADTNPVDRSLCISEFKSRWLEL